MVVSALLAPRVYQCKPLVLVMINYTNLGKSDEGTSLKLVEINTEVHDNVE